MNSLGLNKAPGDTRVVVAMSGGVDSSVTAAMLKAEGYDVVGITLQLYDHGAAIEKRGACCAGQDIYDARRVAEMMDFPHYVLDYESRFRDSVIDDFADSYLMGETPIPCVRCNQTVKFRDLFDTAKDLDGDVLATGHYIERRVDDDGTPALYRAFDGGKDQSYFLFATTREQLDFLRFPLGAWPKSRTRDLAQQLGLAIADKPDSQDICFVPDGDYARVVRKVRPEADQPGEIVHMDGRVLGKHRGIIGYTIGQRKGLGIGGLSEPIYVVRLDPEARQVIVGPREALDRNIVHVREVNWLGGAVEADAPKRIRVKLRSAMDPLDAAMTLQSDNRAEVTLMEPHAGVAPGQAAVFYDGERLLGGGWIAGAERRLG